MVGRNKEIHFTRPKSGEVARNTDGTFGQGVTNQRNVGFKNPTRKMRVSTGKPETCASHPKVYKCVIHRNRYLQMFVRTCPRDFSLYPSVIRSRFHFNGKETQKEFRTEFYWVLL